MKSVTLTLAVTLFAFASFAFPLLDPLSIIDSALGTSFVTRNHPNNVAVALAAPPTDLFISEYIEGSSSNKAIEIYNGTGSEIDMDAAGYVIQLYSNGAATPSQSSNTLGVTIPAGGVAVFAHGSAVLGIPPDYTGSAVINFTGDDAVVLRKGGLSGPIVDVIGQIGVDPGTQWGMGDASTQDNTIVRKSTVCAGDTNGSDVFDPATEWNGFIIDTFSNLGSHTANCSADTTPPTVTSIDDGDGDDAVTTGTTLTYTITFNEDIDSASVTATDFDNSGTAGITIGTISETSPGVFAVQVTANSAGSLVLRIPNGSVIEDVAGNDLAVPVVDDTTVTVNIAAPAMSVTPTSHDFGNQRVGTTSASQSITITNTGTADLAISSIQMLGANSGDFAITDPLPGPIAPGNSASVNAVFSPAAIGSRSATVRISGSGPGANAVPSGDGHWYEFVPGNVTWSDANAAAIQQGGHLVTISSASENAFVANLAGGTYGWLGATDDANDTDEVFSWVNGEPFAFANWAPGEPDDDAGTGGNGEALATGMDGTWVDTDPNFIGFVGGYIVEWDTTPPNVAAVSLTGTGVLPVMTTSPGTRAFGNVSVGTPSSSQDITITNSGNDTLNYSISITGGDAGDFAVTGSLSGTVAAGDSVNRSLTFTPSSTGGKAATLNVAGDDPTNVSDEISLSGTGTAPEIEVAPASMSFGTQAVGSTSGTRSVTISNTGDANLSIGTLVKSGDNAGDFTITTNPSNTVIAPAGTAKLRVTFSPSGTGSRTAQISIPSNDSDEANVIVNLSGTGTAAVTPAPVKSMWVWGGTPNPVTDPTGRANLISRATANSITDLYVSVRDGSNINTQGWAMYPTLHVAALVSAAHAAGLKIWYTSGDPAWQDQPCNSTASSYQRMQEVVAYNNFVAANERFDGVMLDVEPGLAFNLTNYANMHTCFRGILPAEVKLGTAINAFWHSPYRSPVEYPIGGEIKSPSEHIIDLPLDQIVVMGYRDNAGATGGNGIIGLDEDEISYASSIGKAGLVLAGLETNDLGVPAEEHVTFFEEGNVVLNSESALVASHFAASSGFGGFSIHAYGDVYLSGAAGWPIGPSAASATISGRVMDANGRAISSAKIVVSDFSGRTRFFYTNTFGYYRTTGLEAGQTYVLSVTARRHTFAAPSQVVSLADNVSGLNFTASR